MYSNKMDERLKELLHVYRNKFAQIDVERIIPFLRDTGVLCSEDVDAILRHASPSQRIHTLLDILPAKGSQAFQTLCLALETTYPHLLTIMLIGASQRTPLYVSRQSSLAGLTSDSECDDKKSTASSTGVGERPFPSASPQPQGAVVSTHDYNMEQSNVALLKAELKIVTTDRDIMKKELKKVIRERDEALKGLIAGHHPDQPANYGTLIKHGGVSMSDKSLSLSRDYESLKMQCEKAMAEVQGLLKQNVDITRKYENCLKEVDYYKKQERAAYTALQNLRMQYEEVVAEKQKLEREVTSLQTIMEDDRKEIADLRRQQQEAMSQEGSGEAINQLYMTTMRKYEAIKDEYDSIRKRYSDLVASHSNNISKLELTQEEVSRLKKQYDEILRECNEAVREKNCLKQQCTKAITEWDSALREKNKLQEELLKIREKYDEMMKEMNTHLIQRQHLNKDLKRLQEERNAAMQEYTLVMSERDTVHKEMDKLQEELTQASKKIKTIEQTTNDSSKERESLLLQIEMLKREIAASLHDRDKAIKECNDLRERFGAKEDTNKEWERSYKDYDYKQEREMTLKEGPNLGSSSHDMYTKAQKERLDNLDQANQEIDRLRKTIEKLQNELQEAQQEAEVSKRRRDWAFNERDKIVQERESIRAHCDKLRRERDRAVSELAEALRDSDDMKKQRNEASKELKELKERLEAEQEKAAVVRHLAAHNHSRDSAIDTDMQEWEIETLHLPVVVVSERDVGFTVAGGRDDPHYGGSDGAIYVTNITKDGPFEGKLRLHDQIVRLNGLECQGAERASVYGAVIGGGGWINMTVRRRRSGGRSLHTAHLHCPRTTHHGLTLHTGVYIANILPGSPAAREGNLAVGDRVLNINGKPVDNIGSCEEAQCLLDTAGDVVQLTTLKSHGSSSLSAPLSSSSSGHNITEDDKSTSSSRPYSSPTSPAKDSGVSSGRSGSRELVKKLMPGSGGGGGCHGEEGTAGKRYGSSEKVVYNVTKVAGENRSRPLDLFMNMVRPGRHSKERGEGRSESREKDDKKKLDHETERAIAQLDSVNNSYHHKSGSNGGTSTTKRPKKREKDKSGGTWPKYRGGGISTWDANSGTIVYTQRRKERPPLSVFLPTLSPSQYSHEEKSYDTYHHEKRIASRSSASPRSTPTSPRNQQFPLYKSLDGGAKSSSYSSAGQVYASQQSSSNMYPSQEVYSSGGPRNPSLDRKSEDSERDRGDRLSSLTPSDTSLDFSVRSGNVGKEELEYYSKKNILKYTQSDSESNMSPVDPNPPQSLSLPPVYGTRPSPHHGDRNPSHSRIPHPHAGLYSPPNPVLRSPPSFTPYIPVSHISLTHTHSYPHSSIGSSALAVSPRYSSPPTISQGHFLHSRSGDSILSSPGLERELRERGYYETRQASSPTPVGMMGTIGSGVFYHSPSPSLEVPGHHKPRSLHPHPYRPLSDEPPPLPIHPGPPSYHDYQRSTGTMPRKKENERIRIPSNASVASKSSGGKGGSIERSSDRGSPISPNYGSDTISGGSGTGRGPQHVTQITHSVHSPHYQEYPWQRNRPQPGDVRSIYIEKSSEPLGIQIRCLEMGGVYVSAVTVNSLASQVGLCVGDQLLEVCGINMRSATKQSASMVLSQCGTSVTMLVQYNPEKYHEAEGWEGSSSGSSVGGSRSGTPTPRNSPKSSSHDTSHAVDDDDDDDLPPSTTSTLRGPLDLRDTLEHGHDRSLPPSARSTLTRPEIAHVMNSLKRQETFSRRSENGVGGSGGSVGGVNSSSGTGGSSVANASGEARLVYMELNKSHNLGIQMVGGNALGIFVHSVPSDSPAAKAGLRPGDHILEYNGVDLRHATAEQAAFELAKPADNVTMLVQYDYQRYEEIQDKPGDSFYIRALFDRLGDGDSTDLRFRKEDILYVDNTMFNNVPGLWRAWVVDEDGQKRQCGTVPSKDKVEEEMRLQRSIGDLQMDSSRRGSTSARRSFFKRKKHFRSSSRDSKELAVFSDASLNYTEAAPMHDEPSPHSYVRVERLDYLVRRPVVMVGPLWELVCDKLVHDYSHKFTKCMPEARRWSGEELEEAVKNNFVVDYRRRGSHFEATTVSQVKEICDKNCHGILDISLSSVERLHRHNIYPIVLLLKYRHHKQIREVCDSHHPSAERISQKEAKEMYELSIKMEQEYKHVISAVIPAAANMPYISTQVKSCVDQEQSKTLWVPSGSL